MTKIQWTNEARKKFRAFARYIAQESGSKKTSQKWIDTVLNKISRLELFPESGHIYKRFQKLFSQKTRFLVVGFYNIVYQFDKKGNRVIILTVHHAAQEDSLYK